jgi:hypothetical protein
VDFDRIESFKKQYKRKLLDIGKKEIYKWRAVECFRQNWNLETLDLPEMLYNSLAKTRNLLDSGNYYPARMICKMAAVEPERIRAAFNRLYDSENTDLRDRIEGFRKEAKKITQSHFQGKNDYQDHRAVTVYLALKYPDDYYFYKYKLLDEFIKKMNYGYQPRKGKFSNITQYFNVCEIVKEELKRDTALVNAHFGRLGEDDYKDSSLNILTQDFIYAVVNHLIEKDVNRSTVTVDSLNLTVGEVKPGKKRSYNFEGRQIDFVQREKINSRIGRKGELLVLELEKKQAPNKLKDKIEHSSVEIGDGLGYDILSFDSSGQKYIEVKTTTGDLHSPLFITATELARSQKEEDRFFLYRVFNFDEKNNRGDLRIVKGDLSRFCNDPTLFRVTIQED